MEDIVRFLLYNIRYGTGAGMGYHLPLPFSGYFRPSKKNTERIVDFIKSRQPDIIGLVEVDDGSYRSLRLNQAEWIANELGYAHVYETKYGVASWARHTPLLRRQGNAFITNQRIHARKFHYFDRGFKKLVIELEFEHYVIYLVHLSLMFRHRQQQLTDLHCLFQQVNKPMIVAGDFNALWGDHELNLFLAATNLRNANVASLPTFPSNAPQRQLDFVLHSPEIVMHRFEVCPVRYSDHFPICCEFTPPAG